MKKKALFVGVNEYEDCDHFEQLTCACKDAEALCKVFEEGKFDAVRLLFDPTREELKKAVSDAVKGLGPGDFFLFFFAGHGFIQGVNELIFCKDDLLENLHKGETGTPFDTLLEWTEAGGYHRSFILDACRSGYFSGIRGVLPLPVRQRDIRSETRKIPGYRLAPSAPVASITEIHSCRKYDFAREIPGIGHGLFSQALLDVLTTRDKKQDFSICQQVNDSVFKQMQRIVKEKFPREYAAAMCKQMPMFTSSGVSSPVIFEAIGGAYCRQDVAGPDVVCQDNIILPVKVIDEYLCMLGRCGKSDIVRRMKTLGKDVKHKGERTGWRISNTSAFIELIASVPVISVDEMRTKRAADRHGEIIAWFKNHRIDKEFDSATRAILQRIHVSITNTPEED